MASPQVENGFTRVSNELLEKVCQLKINATQFKIILIVWRYTYGFSRKQHALSVSFIAQAIQSDVRTVKRELNRLIDMKIISVILEASFNTTRVIAFNKDFDKWLNNEHHGGKSSPRYQKDTSSGGQKSKNDGKSGGESDTQERKSLKKSFKESKPVKHRYGEYRHVLLTDEQKDRLINELGQSTFDNCIAKLDEYIQETGKRYSDHNLTIRRWVIKAVAQEQGGETYGDKYKTDGCDSTDYYKQFTAQEDAN